MVVPENVALAAYRRDPEDRGVVEAWVESGGDANGRWDAEVHGGRSNVHLFLKDSEMRGDPLLLMVVYGTVVDDRPGATPIALGQANAALPRAPLRPVAAERRVLARPLLLA